VQLRLIQGFRLSTQSLRWINILGYTRQHSRIIRAKRLTLYRQALSFYAGPR
jgi:hypothetical protein